MNINHTFVLLVHSFNAGWLLVLLALVGLGWFQFSLVVSFRSIPTVVWALSYPFLAAPRWILLQ